ncbi:MAG: polyphosphate kinase 2 family protein [Candidatus Limnocylindrales bacterium]
MPDLKDLRATLRVKPDDRIDLSKLDPGDSHGWNKDDGEEETAHQVERLAELQDRFWAGAQKSLLVVLQGIDASGKDGAIRRVMTAFNPQGCYVASFKVPTPEEAAHDFLWRVHKKVPGKGEIGIFNRSHYEEVLVVRVHEFVPKSVWKGRYELIREFEEMLTATGTTIVKFFLFIDREEQRERLQERYDNPKKRWKFSMGDIEERKRWDDYMDAYEDVLSKTSTSDSPWYVIPSNRNWFRDLAISTILAETIDDLKPDYPAPEDLPEKLTIE